MISSRLTIHLNSGGKVKSDQEQTRNGKKQKDLTCSLYPILEENLSKIPCNLHKYSFKKVKIICPRESFGVIGYHSSVVQLFLGIFGWLRQSSDNLRSIVEARIIIGVVDQSLWMKKTDSENSGGIPDSWFSSLPSLFVQIVGNLWVDTWTIKPTCQSFYVYRGINLQAKEVFKPSFESAGWSWFFFFLRFYSFSCRPLSKVRKLCREGIQRAYSITEATDMK